MLISYWLLFVKRNFADEHNFPDFYTTTRFWPVSVVSAKIALIIFRIVPDTTRRASVHNLSSVSNILTDVSNLCEGPIGSSQI